MGSTCSAVSIYIPYYKGEKNENGKRHGQGFQLMKNGNI